MDTNVVIGYLSSQLPDSAAPILDDLPGVISVITRIELLGWYNASPDQLATLRPFISNAQIHNLNEEIIQQTITLRHQNRIKLPDAVVAATAIVYDYVLISRNAVDFQNIKGLKFENPWLW